MTHITIVVPAREAARLNAALHTINNGDAFIPLPPDDANTTHRRAVTVSGFTTASRAATRRGGAWAGQETRARRWR